MFISLSITKLYSYWYLDIKITARGTLFEVKKLYTLSKIYLKINSYSRSENEFINFLKLVYLVLKLLEELNSSLIWSKRDSFIPLIFEDSINFLSIILPCKVFIIFLKSG